jgi:nicotinate dehydrogenase subunit A
MPQEMTLNLNGENRDVAVEPDSMLLYALRNNLGLHGQKFGCGLGECGACTALMNGFATRSCVMPMSAAKGAKIVTPEGLGTIEKPHPTRDEIKQALDANLCRCGTHMRIVRAIQRAARQGA